MHAARSVERPVVLVLARAGLSCPDLTFERFKRCLDYAVECDWGARLFA